MSHTFYLQSKTRLIPLKLELALTPFERAYGLMNRTRLDELHGMLFVYPEPRHDLSVWMKNTLIPLDVLFLDSDGYVQCIRQGAPHDETSLSCYVTPSKYMLELPLGTCNRYRINTGDRLVLRDSFIN